jgi:predicted enzyme related to lactoylglutathione lyase
VTTTFSLFEIRVRDIERAAAFYGRLFDWRLGRAPGAPSALIDTGRRPSGALLQMPDDVPLTVCPYLEVDDCVALARQAADAGAQRLLEGEPLGGASKLSLILDAWGNHLALLETGDEAPTPQGSARHPFAWLELAAPLLDDAVAFYGQLFGWSFEHVGGDEGGYAWTRVGDIGLGLRGGGGLASQRGLQFYVGVDDLDAALQRARELGARRVGQPQPFAVSQALTGAGEGDEPATRSVILRDHDDLVLGLLGR